MKVIDVVKIGFSTALFGGAVLWAYADGGWEPYLSAVGAFAAIIYFFNEIKSASENAVTPTVYSSNRNQNNNGTILNGFVNNGHIVLGDKSTSQDTPSEDSIQNTLRELRSSFLMTVNVVELRRISHQVSELKAYSADALMLYELVDKAIKFHESKGLINLFIIISTLTAIAMSVLLL